MHGHQRARRDARTEVAGGGARLLGDQLGECVGVARDDLLLASEQRRARRDDPGGRLDALAEVAARALARAARDEPRERVDDGRARRALADRRQELVLEDLEAAVDEILLAREVVEDGRRRDLGRARDVGHGDGVEAARGEELHRRRRDRLTRPLLLPLAQPLLGHVPSLSRVRRFGPRTDLL